MPSKLARLLGLATVVLTAGSFSAVGSFSAAAGARTGETISIPGLSLALPPQIELDTSLGATCTACRRIKLTNTANTAHNAELSIAPYDTPTAKDRSVGEWLFSYTRELGRTESGIAPVAANSTEPVSSIATTRRFGIRALQLQGKAAAYVPGSLALNFVLAPGEQRELEYYDGPTRRANLVGSELQGFVYWSMWAPLRYVALQLDRAVDYLLPKLGVLAFLLLLVLLIRAITFPINRWSARQQTAFSNLQEEIAPQIIDIKSRLRGADQSEAILALYTSRGASPFGGLKGSVGLFVQIPILIAMFNVASESAALQGMGALWIDDLSQPERLLNWGIDLPLLGRYLNPIALALAGFMLWAELKKPQLSWGSVIFAGVLGVLLYSFPAFLVIYWLLISIAQYLEGMLN